MSKQDDLHAAIDALGSGESNFTADLKAVLHGLAGGPVPHPPTPTSGGDGDGDGDGK